MSTIRLGLVAAALATVAACSGSAEPELALLNDTPTELPERVTERAGLPLDQLTHVADVDHFSVYVSRDDADWCMIVAIEPTTTGSDWAVGSSCGPSERFATDGIRLRTTSAPRHGEAWLLPDDFEGEVGDDWERINDNLAVRR